jgi:uncharacterized membrane protein YdjX (TVP38/TMEM64 family)
MLYCGVFWQFFLWLWQSQSAKVGIPKEIDMKSQFLLKLLLIAGLPGALWVGREPLAALWMWFSDQEAVTASITRLGVWGTVILAVLFILQVFFAFIPGQALMIACGFLYGFEGGFLLSWLSLVAGGEMAFLLARRYGRAFVERWISPHILARWDKTARGQGVGFFAVSLVLPLVPNDAMCYLAGLGRISHRHFSVANLLGRGVACLFTSALGAFGGRIPWQVWAVLIAILFVAGLVWLVARTRNFAWLKPY